jgi:6-phosphofructokinase 1
MPIDSPIGGVALLAHGGGPTPVINASLAGVVQEARRLRAFPQLWGAVQGMDGVLCRDFIDLFAQSDDTLARIAATPSSALGTSRRSIDNAEIEDVLNVFRTCNIRTFFYTGGNGSMGTALQLANSAKARGYELQVIGIPKTIDNDLAETDHAPGYASTARFFACAVRDIGADNRSLSGQVEFVEVLGRNAGWLTAATCLARSEPDDAPHLIYLPESPLRLEQLLDDVDRIYRRLNRCVVAVCEGQLDEHGESFGADVRQGSRGKLAMNLAHRLAMLVSERLRIRARSEKPGLLGRAAASERSVDGAESRLCGEAAVRAARDGVSGAMVTLNRDNGPEYAISTGLAPLERVAYVERLFPAEWRSPSGNDILPQFRDYLLPLTGVIRSYERLSPRRPKVGGSS